MDCYANDQPANVDFSTIITRLSTHNYYKSGFSVTRPLHVYAGHVTPCHSTAINVSEQNVAEF